MFASPSPKNNRLNKCTSQGEIRNLSEHRKPIYNRDKFKEKILRNYMLKYNLSQVSEKITQEVNKFFLKPNINNHDLKTLDIQLANIIHNKESSPEKMSSSANLLPIKNSDESLTKSGVINPQKQLANELKLPTIFSKSVNKQNIRTESRESGMSGCSELSKKYSEKDEKKQNLEQLIKNYFEQKNNNRSPRTEITKEDDVQKSRQIEQKMCQSNLKKELESQIEDRKSRKIQNYKSSRDFDKENLNMIDAKVNPEKERELYIKNKKIEQKYALDQIMKEEKVLKALKRNQDKQLDNEAIKNILNEIKMDEMKVNVKRKRKNEYYDQLKIEMEHKRKRDNHIIQLEKDSDKKFNEDIEKIIEKKDYARYLELTNKGLNPNPKYENLKRGEFVRETQLSESKSLSSVALDKMHEDEETMLKRIQMENIKKYEELEKKIKFLEDKLEVKSSIDATNHDKVKIIRPSNSFIGQGINNGEGNKSVNYKVANIAKNVNNIIKNVDSMPNSNLKINIIKETNKNQVKPVSSSLFATQISK